MVRRFFVTPIIALILFTNYCPPTTGIAQESTDPALKLIPAETTCCARFHNPGELIHKVGDLIDKLAIPDMPPINPLFMILTQILQAELTDVGDVENLGLDAESDLAIFWLDPRFQNILIAIHVKERSLAEEWLTTRFHDLSDTEHNGVGYLAADGGMFVFLDDIMLYAQDEADGKRCIDAYSGKQPSILSMPEDASTLSLENTDGDVVGFISLGRLAKTFGPSLEMSLSGLKEQMKSGLERGSAGQPGKMTFASLLMAQMDLGLWAFQEAQSFAATLAFDTNRVQLDATMTFRSESEIQSLLSLKPGQVKLFSALPEDASVAGGIVIDPDGMVRMAAVILDRLIALNPQIEADDVQTQRRECLEAVRELLDLLGDEAVYVSEANIAGVAGVAMLAVAAFTMSLAQDMTYIFDISDEPAVKDYLTHFISRMDAFSAIFRALGIPDDANLFTELEKGDAEEYNATSIESIHIPNYPAIPMPGRTASPQKSSLRYALKSGKLVLSLSRDARWIKSILDVLDGKRASLTRAKGFEGVSAALPAEGNFVYYISPVGYIKSMMESVARMGGTIPEEQLRAFDAFAAGIGIGSSIVLRGGKAEGRMYISVDEAKDLIEGFVAMTQGDRIRQQTQNQMRQYREAGDLDKMLELAGEMIETNPQNLQMAQYELIEAFAQNNRLNELESYLQEAIGKHPTESAIYKALGALYRWQSDNTRAIEMYEKVVALNQNDMDAYSSLGDVYQAEGMPQKAIAAYKKALELSPGATHLFPGLARAYASDGQYEEALKLAEEMKKQVGNNAYSHLQLGEVYEAAGEEEKALEAFEKAVELEPEQYYFKDRLASAYERAGKDDLAAELREELRLPPGILPTARRGIPEFSLQTPDGRTVKLSDFEGKAVVLNFWATWAPACMREMAALDKLYSAHKEELVVIGISVDTDGADVVRSYLEKRNITYPIVIATREMLDEYELALGNPIETIPTTIIVDERRLIRDELAGSQDGSAFEAAIRKLLAGEEEPAVVPAFGLIKGKVTDTQTPMPNNLADALVTVQNDLLLGAEPRTVTTDAAGNYEISNLPPGEYIVRVSKPGYNDSTDYVTVVPGGESFHDVRLYKSD